MFEQEKLIDYTFTVPKDDRWINLYNCEEFRKYVTEEHTGRGTAETVFWAMRMTQDTFENQVWFWMFFEWYFWEEFRKNNPVKTEDTDEKLKTYKELIQKEMEAFHAELERQCREIYKKNNIEFTHKTNTLKDVWEEEEKYNKEKKEKLEKEKLEKEKVVVTNKNKNENRRRKNKYRSK